MVATPDTKDSAPTTNKNGTERILAEVLAGVVHAERVPVDSHFFDDLGANSLVMAHFCARVRKRDDLPSVSIKDVYRHPTIRSLAAALADAPAAGAARPGTRRTPRRRAAPARYVLCGAPAVPGLRSCTACLGGLVIAWGYAWISAGSGAVDVYLRSVVFGGARVPRRLRAARWWPSGCSMGRWKPRRDPRLGPGLPALLDRQGADLNANPMLLFAGNPLYVLYLRALGARIGKGVTILSPTVPVCTDLLTIGAGTVIRKDSLVPRLPGARRADPDRPGHPRQGRLRRREDRARHRHLDGRRGAARATPPRCTAARRYRPVSAGTAPPPSAPRSTTCGSRRPTAAHCAGRATPWPPLLQLLFVYMPLTVGGG